MAKVTAKYPGEPIESMLRRFKKKVVKENILQDLRKHEEYTKPSEKRIKEQNERRKKIAKATAKMKSFNVD